jgi:MoaA/NifB/PqqE/SkfB family radical SAM enzyme
MIADEYSPYKIIHHTSRLEDIRNKKQIIPTQVQIIISDLCNHNCNFCSYRLDGYTSSKNFGEYDAVKNMINKNPNRMIPYEKVIEILDDCKEMGVGAIQFTGGGEPTVHPKHKEIIEHAFKNNLEVALVTNGYIIKEGIPDILSNASWVRFSMDAGTKETYSKMREISESGFNKFQDNVSNVVKAKQKNNGKVILGIGFVVTKENYKEIYEGVKIASELGVDNVRISAIFQNDNSSYFSNFYEEAKEMTLKAVSDFGRKDFKVFNLFGDRFQDLKEEKPDYSFCGYMQFNTYIGGDLKVYTCCNNAYNDVGEVGSIKDIRFKDFWLSDKKQDFFNSFDAKKCDRCMFNNKNNFINYAIKDNPSHINFV